MPGVRITILTPSDRQLIGLFESICGGTRNIEFVVQVGGLQTSVSSKDIQGIANIKNAGVSAISSASAGLPPNISVIFSSRQIQRSDNPDPAYVTPHSFYSSIAFIYNPPTTPTVVQILEVQVPVMKFLQEHSLLPNPSVLGRSEENASEAALLSAIRSSASDQVSRVNDFFADLVTRFDERARALDAKYEERRQELDTAHDARAAALAAEQAALDQTRRELDDRSNTHARRATSGQVLETLRNRQGDFKISPDTRRLRTPIHAVFLLLLAATFAGAAWSLYVWGANPADSWGPIAITSAIKTAVFGFGFLTSAGLYVSWLNRWFDRHSDAQFQTKQLEIDFNRATWAVEAALEWKSTQSEEMPEALMVGITRHLFEATPGESVEYSPLEALASNILGAASNLKMNMGGNELYLDRKSLKALRKEEK